LNIFNNNKTLFTAIYNENKATADYVYGGE